MYFVLNFWRPSNKIPRPLGCVPLKLGGPFFQIVGHGGSITVLPRSRLTRRCWLTPESAPVYSDSCCWTSYTKTALTSTTRPSRTQISKLFQRINFFFYISCANEVASVPQFTRDRLTVFPSIDDVCAENWATPHT